MGRRCGPPDDDDVRAIILTGHGGDFAAGADVGEMGTGGVRGNLVKLRTLHRMVRSVAHTHKPVIAGRRRRVHRRCLCPGAVVRLHHLCR